MYTHVHVSLYVCAKQPLRRRDPMHGAVSIHRGESCAAACKAAPAATGVRLPIAAAGSLTPAVQRLMRAWLVREQRSIASHRRPCISEAVAISHTPWSKQCYEASDQRHARTDRDKHKAGRRIMDCSQLAPASHFFSFPCMRIDKGLHATKRWGLS